MHPTEQTQQTKFAEIDAEQIRRANRIGSIYPPRVVQEEEEEPEEIREDRENEQETTETEEDRVIIRGDNLPIVDLTKCNTDGEEAKYLQINLIVGKLTTKKKATEDHIKKAECEFVMDLGVLSSETAIDPELTRVRNSVRREDRETTPDDYRSGFDNFSIRWRLIFVDDKIVISIDL